ncbi:MAG: hypothetical protein ACRDAU_08055 [Clostridium sp.]
MKRSTLTGLLGLTTGMIMGVVGCKTCKCVKKMVKECHSCKTICDYDDYCDCDDYIDEDFDMDDEDEEIDYDIEYKYEPTVEAFEGDEIINKADLDKEKMNKPNYNVESKDKSYNVENKEKSYNVENKVKDSNTENKDKKNSKMEK